MPDDSAQPVALTPADTRRVARLARLNLSDAEAALFTTQLAAILDYMTKLRALDLAGVEPLASPLDMGPPLDDDVPGPTLPTSVLMDMAPKSAPPFISVPKVIGEEGAA